MCIIPGCQKLKYVDSSAGATHDYCGKSHADEGKRKGIYGTCRSTFHVMSDSVDVFEIVLV